VKKSDGYIDFEFDLTVEQDVRIVFYNKGMMDKKMKMFQLWFNTSFFEPSGKMVVDKYMLDGATKDKANKHFATNFKIEIDGCLLTHPTVLKY
jgi:C2 domain of PTEN tumour-suppressor protein